MLPTKSEIPAIIGGYVAQGYTELPNPGGTGAQILAHRALNKVVKFSGDPSFDHFAEFVQNNEAHYFPKIYLHDCPDGPFELDDIGQWPQIESRTEMEYLDSLPPQHHAGVAEWIAHVMDARRDQKSLPPLNGLEQAIDVLFKEVDKERESNHRNRKIGGLDLKLDNIMVRPTTGQWVIIDGFGSA